MAKQTLHLCPALLLSLTRPAAKRQTGIVQDVLDLYVKQSHEVFEQSRNLLVVCVPSSPT
jgi:hypothetical protein